MRSLITDANTAGSRRIFVGVWVFLHALVFTFGYLNYSRKDNLTRVRALFGVGYPSKPSTHSASPAPLLTLTSACSRSKVRRSAVRLR